MKTILRSMVVLAVLASIPMTASAQVGVVKRLVTVGVGGGMSVPVSDAGDAFNNGFHVQGFARLNVPKLPVMPRFDLNFSRLAFDETALGVPGTEQILSGLANLQLSVLPMGPLQPYLIAGVGAYNLKTETDGVDAESKTHFGINGGAGVALHLGMINGFVEGRVDNVYTEEGAIDTKQVQFIPVTFGLTF